MFKGSIWECDNCQKQHTGEIFPGDWLHIEITKGMSWTNAIEKLKADYCSRDCMIQGLVAYLGQGSTQTEPNKTKPSEEEK